MQRTNISPAGGVIIHLWAVDITVFADDPPGHSDDTQLELTAFASLERGSSLLENASVLCERDIPQQANIPLLTGLATVMRRASRRGASPTSLLKTTGSSLSSACYKGCSGR